MTDWHTDIQCTRILFGSGALSGKMLLVRIVENDKIDAHLGQVKLRKGIISESLNSIGQF